MWQPGPVRGVKSLLAYSVSLRRCLHFQHTDCSGIHDRALDSGPLQVWRPRVWGEPCPRPISGEPTRIRMPGSADRLPHVSPYPGQIALASTPGIPRSRSRAGANVFKHSVLAAASFKITVATDDRERILLSFIEFAGSVLQGAPGVNGCRARPLLTGLMFTPSMKHVPQAF